MSGPPPHEGPGSPTPPSERRLRRVGLVLWLLLWAGLSQWRGREVSWDLLNHHYYLGWSGWSGRLFHDLAAAQGQSFHPPFADMPFFALAHHLPARLVAALLAMVHALGPWAVAALGDRHLRLGSGAGLRAAQWLLTLGAATGLLTWSQLGGSQVEIWLAPLLTLALGLLLRGRPLAAGLLGGAVVGLRPSLAPYGLALGATALALRPSPSARAPSRRAESGARWSRLLARIQRTAWVGLGGVLGVMLSWGHWLWRLWRTTGNPLFPHFNDVFESPWTRSIGYADDRFGAMGPLQRLWLPWTLWREGQTGSPRFSDPRLGLIWLLLALWLGARLWRAARARTPSPIPRRADRTVIAQRAKGTRAGNQGSSPADLGRASGTAGPAAASAIAICLAAGAGLWTLTFPTHRFLLPLEQWAPLLALALGHRLPGSRAENGSPQPLRVVALLGLLALLGSSALGAAPDWGRQPWTPRWLDVARPPPVDPEAVVLLAGDEPTSFALTRLPPGPRYLRIASNMSYPDDPTRIQQTMRALSDNAPERWWLGAVPPDDHSVRAFLRWYGLRGTRCVRLPTNLAAGSPIDEPLWWCELTVTEAEDATPGPGTHPDGGPTATQPGR